jgi:hypothetical protein
MDAQQALQAARELLAWAVPLVAAGVLAKVGENAADQASQTLGRAWRALHGWLARDADAADDLRRLEKQPQSAGRQQIVAEAVAQIATRDAAVAAELEALVQAIAQLKGGAPGRTHQINVSGNAQVGQAIAGDVHGGLTVGPIDFSKKTIVAGPRAGANSSLASPATSSVRPPLPATLSADGEHFTYGHALLIGVGTYQRDGLSVATTAADAVRLGELLRDPHVAAYPTKQVTALLLR